MFTAFSLPYGEKKSKDKLGNYLQFIAKKMDKIFLIYKDLLQINKRQISKDKARTM